MAAPSSGFWTALVLAAAALKLAAAVSEPTTVPFDVRPGGVVHSFSQDIGPGVRATGASMPLDCRHWGLSWGLSPKPQGKSYLYFTQFKAELQGAEIEYAMAYSKAAFERESDVPLKSEEFEVTKTAVSHRPGAFKAELSKLVIVAKAAHSEL
uniref:Myeloid-derived growth factor n=1 Tax=Rattus norvegicus TaxID=10116 RepID=A0A8I5YCH2_RAT